MKHFNIILSFVTLLFLTTAIASKTKHMGYIEATSVGKYKKPGAPVDIAYKTERILAGEESNISIRLIPAVKRGEMRVTFKWDKRLAPAGEVESHYLFTLGKKEYPVNFTVIASSDGIYYIRLIVEIEGKGFRAFAVPVHVGEMSENHKHTLSTKNSQGKNITVMHAQEKIMVSTPDF